MSLVKYVILLFIGIMCIYGVSAEVILTQYTFPAGNFGTTTNANNITGGNITNIRTLPIFEISSNGYVSDPELRVAPFTGNTTYPLALSGGSYFTFNITPSVGYAFNITNITFLIARGGASTPRGYGLQSSLDNYVANISNADVTTQRAIWSNISIIMNTNFTNMNNTLIFRFFIYSTTAGSSIEIDNLTIYGDVFPILPTIENLTLNMTSMYNFSIDNLTCNYNLNGTAITSAISWYKNNQPLLSLYMPFEGNSTNALKDYSGYDINGTGNIPTWSVTGGYNNTGAYNFNGINNYISMGNQSQYNLDDNFTVAFWLKLKYANASTFPPGTYYRYVTTKQDYNTATGWDIAGALSDNTISFIGENSGGGNIQSFYMVSNFNWSQWHRFVFLISNTTGGKINVTLYVDDNYFGSGVNANSIVKNSALNLTIGRFSNATRDYLNGTIDDLRSYNYIVSPEQIKAISQNLNNVIVSQELKANDVWQCRVTPFNSIIAGTEYISNNITIRAENIRVVILEPLGKTENNNRVVHLVSNLSAETGINYALSYVNVTAPNSSTYLAYFGNFTLYSDDFSSDTGRWNSESTKAVTQTCRVNISGNVPGKLYTSLTGNMGSYTDTYCSAISNNILYGDFDINVSFAFRTPQVPDSSIILSFIQQPSFKYANKEISFALSNWTGYEKAYELFVNDDIFNEYILYNDTGMEYRPTEDVDGKIRVVRVDNNFTFYTWNITSSDWILENVMNNTFNLSKELYVILQVESAYPTKGEINVTWDDFNVISTNYSVINFGGFPSPITFRNGTYNVSYFITSIAGTINNTMKDNFTLLQYNQPVSIPYILSPYEGEVIIGVTMYNITWSNLVDLENDNTTILIELYNLDSTFNRTIVSNYGTLNSTYYEWNLSGYTDNEYIMKISAVETLYPAQNSSYIMANPFILSLTTPILNNLILNATTQFNQTIDNLTCNYDYGISATTSVVNWYKNSQSIFLLNMPFEYPSVSGNTTGKINGTLDYSGFNNHGKVINATWNSSFGGYQFNNVNTYIIETDSSSLDIGNDKMSIEAWVNPAGCQATDIIMSKGNAYRLDLTTGCFPRFRLYATTDNVLLTSTIAIPTNSWSHIVAVYNSTNMMIYVNGVLNTNIQNNTGIVDNVATDLYIGSSPTVTTLLNGKLKSVAIYNRSLSANEILLLNNSIINKIVSQETNLSETWKCVVTPFSNIAVGATYTSNNITILPTATPTLYNLLLSSTTGYNFSTDNLTCNYVLNGSGATSAVAWYKNNTPQMLAYYPMEGNSTNALLDYSGNGNDGTNSGAVWNLNTGQNGNGSFYFNGASYIMAEDSKSLNVSGDITVSAWVKGGAQGNFKYVLSKLYDADHVSYGIYSGNAGGMIFYIGWGSGAGQYTLSADYGSGIWNNNWHHVVGIYDHSNLKLYVDGAQSGANVAETRNINYSTNNLYLGSYDGTQLYFTGYIDDVRVYNYSLSSQQILALYNNRTDLIVSNELNIGDVWQCRVTPFSSTEAGTTVNSNNVTIISTFIGIGNILLNSTYNTNRTEENLTCNFNLIGLSTTSTITWYKNNVSIMRLNLPFEGNSTNALLDYSGYGNNATNVGGNWFSNIGYNGQGAYNFSTADSYVRVPPINLRSNNVTIMAWIKGTGDGEFAGIIFSRSGSTIAGLNYHSTGLRYHWNDDAGSWGFNSGLIIPTNIWTFVVLVITPQNATLYVNNNSATNVLANTIEEFDGNTSIGDDGGAAGRYWIGAIDEVKIFNYSLNNNEILNYYNNKTNLIMSEKLTNNDVWQCRVTPFNSLQAGTTTLSNNLTIDMCIPPMYSNWDLTLHCNIISRIYNRATILNISRTGWLNISGNSIINFTKIIWYPKNDTEIFRIRYYNGSKVRVPG